jgi:hypothetical protein
MPRPLYPLGKSPRYPLDRRLGRFQNRSGQRGEEKKFCTYRDSNSDPSVFQPIVSRYPVCAAHSTSYLSQKPSVYVLISLCLEINPYKTAGKIIFLDILNPYMINGNTKELDLNVGKGFTIWLFLCV